MINKQNVIDTISRQAAIEAIGYSDIAYYPEDSSKDVLRKDSVVKKAISELPPAQPERIRGRWIYHPEWANNGECGYECSVCHMGSDVDYNFCMRCGADMRVANK